MTDTAKKRGRPTLDTPEVRAKILAGLADGIPLTVICAPDDMPAWRTVYSWETADKDFSADIAHAREAGEYKMAWECKQIADTPCEGVEEEYSIVEVPADQEDDPPTEEFKLTKRKVGDMTAHRKLQIETRLKLLAKFNPRKWGDRMAVEHDIAPNLADDLKAARERAQQES